MPNQRDFPKGRFHTEAETEDILKIRKKTLQKWRWEGLGPAFYKFGRSVRYSDQDLQAFVAASRRSSTSDDGSK